MTDVEIHFQSQAHVEQHLEPSDRSAYGKNKSLAVT